MYRSLARFYDAIHAELTEDIPFILKLVARCGSPILELGCGTGRLMLPLLQHGYAVTGVDNAASMLDVAKRKLSDYDAELVAGDMTHLDTLAGNFACVLVGHNTAHELPVPQLGKMARAAASHLNVGGCLLLDLTNPFLLATVEDQLDYQVDQQFSDPNSGRQVTRLARWRHDQARQIVAVEWRFVLADEPPLETGTRYYYTYPSLLYPLLQQAGLAWEISYGDYEGSRFEEDSDRLIVVARRT